MAAAPAGSAAGGFRHQSAAVEKTMGDVRAAVAGRSAPPHPPLPDREVGAALGGTGGWPKKMWPWWGEHRRRRRAPPGGEQQRGEGPAPGRELGGGGERRRESDGAEGLGAGRGGYWASQELGG